MNTRDFVAGMESFQLNCNDELMTKLPSCRTGWLPKWLSIRGCPAAVFT